MVKNMRRECCAATKNYKQLYSLQRLAPHPWLILNFMDFVAMLKHENDTLATISLKRPGRSEMED